MVVKSNFSQKYYFVPVIVFLEIRYSFRINLKLAEGIKRDTRNSLTLP